MLKKNFSASASIIAHHMRLFGIRGSCIPEDYPNTKAMVLDGSLGNQKEDVFRIARHGGIVVLLHPNARFLDDLDVELVDVLPGPQNIRFPKFQETAWRQSRTLHDVQVYICRIHHTAVAVDGGGGACWIWVPLDKGGILIVGTNLAGDLVRYRQGDPGQVGHGPAGAYWGFLGERPNYLYDGQIPPGSEHDRPADWWAMALAKTVSGYMGESLEPLLPNGALGAVVITGDDDQAWLEKYEEQLDLLDGLPITYFLHPLTCHTPKTLKQMTHRNNVELGLHPDALETPQSYAKLFHEQATWFQDLTGQKAKLVRNHGFLNDGYWQHLPVWLEHNILASSNLPGLNGKILNGSLLPARMVWDGQLTSHWSILTAIGDGVRFALGLDGPQSAQCIRDLADRVLASKLPGVIVLNLHPQNINETRDMHLVLHELVRDGFLPITLGGCIDWFSRRDRGVRDEFDRMPGGNLFARLGKSINRWSAGVQGRKQ